MNLRPGFLPFATLAMAAAARSGADRNAGVGSGRACGARRRARTFPSRRFKRVSRPHRSAASRLQWPADFAWPTGLIRSPA
jgi:hypothetical protein